MKAITRDEWIKFDDAEKWRRFNNLCIMYEGQREWVKALSDMVLNYQKQQFAIMMNDFSADESSNKGER